MALEQIKMFKFVALLSFVACALGAAIPDGMLPQLDGRIVGGTAAQAGEFPYIVSLIRSGSHFCGGSLYSKNVVLTAAHCLRGVSASAVSVRVGSLSRTSGGTIHGGSSITLHSAYNPNTMVNDIAILRLSSSVSIGGNIQTIAMVASNPAAGTKATVAGWGTLSSGGSSPTNLQKVVVTVVSKDTCVSKYGLPSADFKTSLCAADAGKDSCQGDSGGPLVIGTRQAGIVSWGYGCADARYPGVYTNVYDLLGWIQSNA